MQLIRLLFLGVALSSTVLAKTMQTPSLIQAVRCQHMSFFFTLLRGRADVNVVTASGRSAAHYAVEQNNMLAVQRLIANGADVNLADNNGKTPLDLWQVHKNEEMLTLLHKAGEKPLDLWQAAIRNDIASAKRLLAVGASARAIGYGNKIPFQLAVEAEHYALASILLRAMAGVETRDDRGWRPIHWAVLSGDWELVRELVRDGASIMAGHSQNALDVAYLVDSEAEFIESVVAEKGVAAEFGWEKRNMLMMAADRGYVKAVEILLTRYQADPNSKDNMGKTALFYAVKQGSKDVSKQGKIDVVKLLAAHNAEINIESKGDSTPLRGAISSRNIDMIKLLVDLGAEVNVVRARAGIPLASAIKHEMLEAVELFIEHGADVNVRDSDGDTPLILTARQGITDAHLDIIALLIEHGAEVNAQNKKGNTPLIATAIRKNTKNAEAAELLIKHGAEVNIQNKYKNTALLQATRNGSKALVQILLANGADPNLRDDKGMSALDIAEDKELHEIADLLRAAQDQD